MSTEKRPFIDGEVSGNMRTLCNKSWCLDLLHKVVFVLLSCILRWKLRLPGEVVWFPFGFPEALSDQELPSRLLLLGFSKGAAVGWPMSFCADMGICENRLPRNSCSCPETGTLKQNTPRW